MTMIRMNVDEGRRVAGQMNQACDMLHSQLVDLSNCVEPFVKESWISPTATEFSKRFREWSKAQRDVILQLHEMAVSLEFEIVEWESAASCL